jgi:hypothetical protein
MKRVFIVHCWQGHPDNFWYPWLKKELERTGFEVFVPEMPDTDNPKIGPWVETLSNLVGAVDEDTYFVGHSIGCQTIMRYLETLPTDAQIGDAVFVAGWFNLPNLETQEEKDVAEPWLTTEIDTAKLTAMLKDKLSVILSDDDPHVPLSDGELFRDRLGAKVIIEHDMGHFDEETILELPEVLTELK